MTIPVVGAASLFGAVIFYSTRGRKSREQQAQERRDNRALQGVTGAGVGNTHALGGFEVGQPGSGHDSPSEDPERKAQTTAASREDLPSGGVGGGEASPRDINFPGLDKGQTGRDEGGLTGKMSKEKPYEKGHSEDKSRYEGGPSQALQGMFGQGGKTSQDRNTGDRFHDTKIASHFEETPSKKKTTPRP